MKSFALSISKIIRVSTTTCMINTGSKWIKRTIQDDIVFEMELVRQIEVNIDYILMLVAKYHQSNCADKTILVAIDKAIKSSLELRSKKELIENFIKTINAKNRCPKRLAQVRAREKETDLVAIITEET